MTLVVAALGWPVAAALGLTLWRLAYRLRAVRAAGLAALAEAYAWRGRAAEAEHELRQARAAAERTRQSYAKIIGRARNHRYGQYPPTE